jgi:hypothetical protein
MSTAEVNELGQTVLWWNAKENYVGSSSSLLRGLDLTIFPSGRAGNVYDLMIPMNLSQKLQMPADALKDDVASSGTARKDP